MFGTEHFAAKVKMLGHANGNIIYDRYGKEVKYEMLIISINVIRTLD